MSKRRAASKNRDEWFYRTCFEQSGKDIWLVEYGRSPSAWHSLWFRQVVRTKVMVFLRWCNSRKISFGRAATWLNEHGPSPHKGTKWHKSTLRYLLQRSPDSGDNAGIKMAMRLLKGLRWAEANQQPWVDQIAESSESTEERSRRVWEMHRLLLPPFQVLSAHLVRSHHEHELVADWSQRNGTSMQRRGEFGFQFLGSPSLAAKTLRKILQDVKSSSPGVLPWAIELEQLDRAVPQFLDFQPTKFDMELLGQHKTADALLRILCKLEGISTRTARRYKSESVQ